MRRRSGRRLGAIMKTRTKIFLPVFAVALALVGAAVAYAGWCWSDPVIGLKAKGSVERDLTIDVAVPEEYRDELSGPIVIMVVHPRDVTPRVKFMDGILPEKVVFKRSSTESKGTGVMNVEVRVYAPSEETFDVRYRVEFVNAQGHKEQHLVQGTTNTDIVHAATLLR